MNYFLSQKHEIRFNELCRRDKMHKNDIERSALFFVISGSESLYNNVSLLYNFEEHIIKLEVYNQPFLEGDSRSLIDLAFNLYGSDAECDIRYLFNSLDPISSSLALNAIKFRFQIRDELADLFLGISRSLIVQ